MLPAPLAVEAVCLTVASHSVLVVGMEPAGRESAFGPPVYVRFAFAPALGRDYLIPAQVVEDYGLVIPAPEAYDWLEGRGTLFPRSDVIGLTSGSQPLQRFVKELDLAAPPLAFAARDPGEFPGVQLAVMAAGPAVGPLLHPLLARALPVLKWEGEPLESAVRRWAAG